jgi:hypothetical protein
MNSLSRFSVAEFRRELAQNGVVVLDRFIGQSTLDQIMEEASRLESLGFTSEREHDIYLDAPPAGWHFDESPFAVTLMLRPSERGGDFEFAPISRTYDEKEMTSARRVLTLQDGVRKIAQAPGTLTVFSGRNALHRVAPVQGLSARINAVLTFAPTPGLRLTPETQAMFYGRVV